MDASAMALYGYDFVVQLCSHHLQLTSCGLLYCSDARGYSIQRSSHAYASLKMCTRSSHAISVP